MNKIINGFKDVIKGSYGLFIYLFIQIGTGLVFANQLKSGSYNLVNVILIGSEILTAVLLIILNWKRLKKDFIDFDHNYKKYLAIGFKAWIIGIMVMIISNAIINGYIFSDVANNEAIDRAVINYYPLYSVIAMIFIGPFIEELTFRCGYKDHIKNKKLYYILTVLIFAGAHVINGITTPLELLYLIPYGALAVAFSYTLDKTDNIFTTTIIHTFHNTLSILILIAGMMFGAI
jgi:membrane protease YdiL (CAAX protease family)